MGQSNPQGDVSPASPSDPFSDPFAPLSTQLRQLKMMAGLLFDKPEDFFDDLFEEILAMPVEERFTSSASILLRVINEEFGSADVVRSQLPFDRERLLALWVELMDELLSEVLHGVFFVRNADGHLILAAAIQEVKFGLLNSVSMVENESYEDERALVVFSSLLALYARLYQTVTSGESEAGEELVRDVARALYYRTREISEAEQIPDPNGMESDEVFELVIQYGAGIAYRELDISINRGAELARCSREEFLNILDNLGISPRLGPDSASELREDGPA